MLREFLSASHPVRRAIAGVFTAFNLRLPDEEIDLDPPSLSPPPKLSQTGVALLKLADAIQNERISEEDWRGFLDVLRLLRFKPKAGIVMKDVDDGLVKISIALHEKEWTPLTGEDEEAITFFATPGAVTSFLDKSPRPRKPQSP